MAFNGLPSSQHQNCTDEAQKAETVLSAVIYIYKETGNRLVCIECLILLDRAGISE